MFKYLAVSAGLAVVLSGVMGISLPSVADAADCAKSQTVKMVHSRSDRQPGIKIVLSCNCDSDGNLVNECYEHMQHGDFQYSGPTCVIGPTPCDRDDDSPG